MKKALLFLSIIFIAQIIVAMMYFHVWTDEYAIDQRNGKHHFIRTHDYIIGSRNDHMLLFRVTEDLGWE